jgi:hypothetical protein
MLGTFEIERNHLCAKTVLVDHNQALAALKRPLKLSQTVSRIRELLFLLTTHCSPLRLIVRFGLDVPTFATRRLHASHHARALSRGR